MMEEKLEPISLLLVEDNEDDAFAIKRLMDKMTKTTRVLRITWATNFERAKNLLERQHFDVVLSDLNLPDSKCENTASGILETAQDSAIIFITGEENTKKFALDAIKLGAQDYLTKNNIEFNSLRNAIEYALERKKVQQELEETISIIEENNHNLRSLMSADVNGALVTDLENKVLFLNKKAASFFDQTPEELIGERLKFAKNSEATKEIKVVSKKNGVRYLKAASVPINWFDNQKANLVSLSDITDYKKSEEYLKKLSKLKSDFVSSVSHELRTPIAIAREGVSLVVDGYFGTLTNEQKDILGRTIDATKRLESIVDDILDISKIESGKINLDRCEFDFVRLASKTVADFRFDEKGTKDKIKCENEIVVDFPIKPIFVFADKNRIVQIIVNLVSNALKFNGDKPVHVKISEKNKKVTFSVSDSGPGIDQADVPHLFEKFRQFNRVNGAGKKGTGLGLAISKELVHLHKGKIWYERDENLGGAKFSFSIEKNEFAEDNKHSPTEPANQTTSSDLHDLAA